jgi:hypothetical protein
VTLLQDQSIEKMHTAFKGLLDEREQVRKTEIKVPMCTSFKLADKHEVDISNRSAVAEMKRSPYRLSCTQVTADPGRHRINLTHVDRDAMKVCEYVRRGRVVVR